MYVLGIETTGAFASVALVKDAEAINEVHGSSRFSHLQELMPQVREVLTKCGMTIGDIDVIAVSAGPGSFTGIRIGVSSARALSQITGLPCVPVSSLEALAMNASEVAGQETLVCPVLDARRQQVYAGAYFIREGMPAEVIKAGPYMADEFMNLTAEHDNIMLLGDGIDKYGDLIRNIRPEGIQTAPEDIRYQNAVSVARIGERIFADRGGLPYDKVKPDYMRIPEAERRLREKQAQERKNETV